MDTRFSAPVHIGPGAHPTSCTMGTGSFPALKRPGRGADPHPHLQCRGLKFGRAIPLPALRALVACYRGNLLQKKNQTNFDQRKEGHSVIEECFGQDLCVCPELSSRVLRYCTHSWRSTAFSSVRDVSRAKNLPMLQNVLATKMFLSLSFSLLVFQFVNTVQTDNWLLTFLRYLHLPREMILVS